MTPETLARLHSSAFQTTRAWTAREFQELLSHPGAILTGDGDGFALLRVIADEAEVLTLATDPARRRLGVARKALSAAESIAQSRGANAIFLEVAEDNLAALGLYAAVGYVQVGKRLGYYVNSDQPPIAALVLRKDLSAG